MIATSKRRVKRCGEGFPEILPNGFGAGHSRLCLAPLGFAETFCKSAFTIENAEHSAEAIFVSAISLVEIVYLGELNRIPPEAVSQLFDVLKDSTGNIVVAPLDLAIASTVERISRQNVPEMPDRIIAATALHLRAELVTRDRRLQAAGIPTVW